MPFSTFWVSVEFSSHTATPVQFVCTFFSRCSARLCATVYTKEKNNQNRFAVERIRLFRRSIYSIKRFTRWLYEKERGRKKERMRRKCVTTITLNHEIVSWFWRTQCVIKCLHITSTKILALAQGTHIFLFTNRCARDR